MNKIHFERNKNLKQKMMKEQLMLMNQMKKRAIKMVSDGKSLYNNNFFNYST